MKINKATDQSFYSEDSSRDFVKAGEKKGTKDEEAGDDNSNQYFSNEEKVIKNHLKLNLGLQVVQLLLFLIATSSFEWAEIVVGSEIKPINEPESLVYDVSLLKAEIHQNE